MIQITLNDKNESKCCKLYEMIQIKINNTNYIKYHYYLNLYKLL